MNSCSFRHLRLLLVLVCCRCFAQTAQAYFTSGQAALSAGHLDEAETDFRQVLGLEQHSVPARANLGVVYMRRRNWPEALEQFHLAEKLAPHNPGIEINIGLLHFRQQEYGAAIPALADALHSNPASLQARYLLALCDFATERYPDAVKNLSPLWDSENGKMTYLYVLALSSLKVSDTTLEQKALQRMYAVGQNTAEYHLFLGRTLLQQGRNAEALPELRTAEDLNAKLPFVHYSLGVLYLTARDYAHARSEFLADVAIEPDLALDQERLGDIAVKLNQSAEAEEHYRQALLLNKQSASVHLGLAKIRKADGRYRDALTDLDAACHLDKLSASAHYLRAQVLKELDEPEKAKAEFAESARLRQSTRDKLEEQLTGGATVDAAMALPQ